MEDFFGVGIIGVGGMGRHAFVVNEADDINMEVRGICDVNLDVCKELAEKHGVGFYTDDYQKLLKRDDIDVIAIYTPDHLHHEHIIASLDAGKHVLVTKPMVTSLQEALSVYKKVKETGLKFLVGQTLRFAPKVMTLKQLLDTGHIGDVLIAESRYVHDLRDVCKLTPWRVKIPQDFLFGGACHPVDLLIHLVGKIKEVQCFAAKSGVIQGYPIEDNFLINLTFENGALGRVINATGVIHPPMELFGWKIFGTKGTIIEDKMTLDTLPGRPTIALQYHPGYGYGNEVRNYFKHFEECIREDKEPLVNARVGVHVIAVLEAVWISHKERRIVDVSSLCELD